MAPRQPTHHVGHQVTTHAWRWFLLAGAAAALLHLAASGDARQLTYEGIAGLAAVAVVIGIRLHAPAETRGWNLLAGGIALWAVGDVVWGAHEAVFDSRPFPSLADVPYLASYPILVWAVARIARHRGGRATSDVPALLDAAAITVAAALPAWILLVAPAAADAALSRVGRVVAIAYPIGDLLLVAVLARLLLAAGRRPPAYWLLLGGLVTSLVADAVFAAPGVADGYTTGGPLDLAYLLGYLLLGAAALHPTMVEVAERDPAAAATTARELRWRIAAVAAAALSAPALLAIESATGEIDHLPLVLVAWVGLLALVLARLVVVMRQLVREGQLDPLTRLANRGHLLARLEHALQQQQPERVAVLHLDLDRFRAVNDAIGRDGGDLVLVAVAERLRTIVRPGDLVARAGGDEFVVMCGDIADEAAARAVATRLTAGLADPFWVDGSPHFVSASIGISRPGSAGTDATALLQAADAAVTRAKARGAGAAAEVYDPEVEHELSLRGRFEHDLYDAVERDQLVLHYQPQLDLRTGEVSGVEALLRWQHPDWGTTKPSSILPIAIETGLIVPIGRWVVTEACRQLAAWHRAAGAPSPPEVSVNVAARELLDPGYVEHVRRALAAADLPAGSLVVEVDDDALGDAATAVVDSLHGLRALGVRVGIDRFGSGRRSLVNVRRVPADRVKVDLGLVSADDSGDRVVLSTVLSLGTALGVGVTVTGVETRSQRTQLERLGCAHAQGNLWAPALPPGSVLDAVLGRAPA